MECFTQFVPNASGAYLMGYLDGSTLIMPTHNNTNTTNSVSMSTTTYSVTPTNDGFTLARGSEPLRIDLCASGNAGQYLICYKGRLLSRSSSSLAWAKPNNSTGNGVNLTSNRWYINDQGIYQQSGSTKYYLCYSNGTFKTSTTNQNNVHFYQEGDCPTTVSLNDEWNWWTPTLEMSLDDLEAALGGNAVLINSSSDMTNKSEILPWAIAMLMDWNEQDPVSQKETDRNNAIYTDYQHNRNPFIDHPEYARMIWDENWEPPTAYSITLAQCEHGEVCANVATATEGQTVTLPARHS